MLAMLRDLQRCSPETLARSDSKGWGLWETPTVLIALADEYNNTAQNLGPGGLSILQVAEEEMQALDQGLAPDSA